MLDPQLRVLDVIMRTEHGTTYNSFLVEGGDLFPDDFLGAHYGDDRLFHDPGKDCGDAFEHCFRGIVRPFKEHVRQGLDKIRGPPLRAVCPSHGPLLRVRIETYLERCRSWSDESTRGDRMRLLVLHASAYGNTARRAEAVGSGAEAAGAEVAVGSFQELDPAACAAFGMRLIEAH